VLLGRRARGSQGAVSQGWGWHLYYHHPRGDKQREVGAAWGTCSVPPELLSRFREFSPLSLIRYFLAAVRPVATMARGHHGR